MISVGTFQFYICFAHICPWRDSGSQLAFIISKSTNYIDINLVKTKHHSQLSTARGVRDPETLQGQI